MNIIEVGQCGFTAFLISIATPEQCADWAEGMKDSANTPKVCSISDGADCRLGRTLGR